MSRSETIITIGSPLHARGAPLQEPLSHFCTRAGAEKEDHHRIDILAGVIIARGMGGCDRRAAPALNLLRKMLENYFFEEETARKKATWLAIQKQRYCREGGEWPMVWEALAGRTI
jgi:hypothetical protein